MNDTSPPTGSMSPAWENFWIVLGAIVLVALAVVIWLLIFRKDGRLHRHRRHHHHRKNYREELKKNADGIKGLIQQGKHGHRHEHRPLNPTLAETGGLPPIRGVKTPPPPQP